jgi:hypothetical protein
MTISFVSLDSLRASALGADSRGVESLTPAPWMHLVPGAKPLVFIVEGSRLYEISPDLFAGLAAGDESILKNFHEDVHGFGPELDTSFENLVEPVSLSLNVAQACNLSCSYCYADEGRFGGAARIMEADVALAAIDRLLAGASGRRVTVGFMGGEPFLNRRLIYRCVAYARARSRAQDAGRLFDHDKRHAADSGRPRPDASAWVLSLGQPGRDRGLERPPPT